MKKKRQKSMHEQLVRNFHREKRKVIAKCEELGIAYHEVNKNDSELYATPNNFICILSPNEMRIGETFIENAEEPESIFISMHDYETYNLF